MNLTKNDDNFLHLTARFTQAVVRAEPCISRPEKVIPYMAHLLGVASMVMGEAGYVEFPVTEDMVLAALLHDAVEDHGGSPRLKHLEVDFGVAGRRGGGCLCPTASRKTRMKKGLVGYSEESLCRETK